MNEKTKNVDGIDIIYKIKNRKYDNNHLVVVFSGFGDGRFFTYDFINALSDSPATILWIKDDFFSMCSYYICRGLDFSIETAVYKFIYEMMLELHIDKNNCTLAGFSKGGTAALYFGAKYNFKNIIATVPQFNIGDYIRSDWPDVAKHMMSEVSLRNTLLLNSLLRDVLDKDENLDKNIYLLTSIADLQYKTEIKPNLLYFIKYRNFNLFYAKSLLVTEHNQVTSYHVPLILGIINSLAQGAVPSYGYSELKGDMRIGNSRDYGTPVAILKKIPLKNNVIFPEGVSLIKGLPCPEFSDIEVDIILSNDKEQLSFSLGKRNRSALSRMFYDGGYVNYDKGWFCTNKHLGIDLSLLPVGVYSASLKISCGGEVKTTSLIVDDNSSINNIISNDSLNVFSKNGLVYITKL
ncbi:accessory Sec system protein Asp2 [Kluyvera cryocrescens]|uniref:accessory Sec system protein Asp2 n=1 Tax=Kluyvera cryocrescens TaxID=580 RepID=UPI00155EC48D|nr:accessory Sec system protein Asp2 [Kluyvera cryocrescens]MEB7557578.1 alpha/beta hydrolase [Kluyvera cryocrescens]